MLTGLQENWEKKIFPLVRLPLRLAMWMLTLVAPSEQIPFTKLEKRFHRHILKRDLLRFFLTIGLIFSLGLPLKMYAGWISLMAFQVFLGILLISILLFPFFLSIHAWVRVSKWPWVCPTCGNENALRGRPEFPAKCTNATSSGYPLCGASIDQSSKSFKYRPWCFWPVSSFPPSLL